MNQKTLVVGQRNRAKKCDAASEKGNQSAVKLKTLRKRKQDNIEESSSAKLGKTTRQSKKDNGEILSTATPAKTPRKRKQGAGKVPSKAAPAKTPRKRKQGADEPSAPSQRPAPSKTPRPAVTKAATTISHPNDNICSTDESQSATLVSSIGLTPASQSSSLANIEFPPAPQETMLDIGSISQDCRRRREHQDRHRQLFDPQKFPKAHGGPRQGFQSSRSRSNSRTSQPPNTAEAHADDQIVPQQFQHGQAQFQGPLVDFEYQQIQRIQQARQAQVVQLQANQFPYGYNASGYPHQFRQSGQAQGIIATIMHNESLARAAQAQHHAQIAAMNGFETSELWQQQQNYDYGQKMGADSNFTVSYSSFAGYQPNVQHNPCQPGRSQSNGNQSGYPPSQSAHRPSGASQSAPPENTNQQRGGPSTMQRQQMQRPPPVPYTSSKTIQGVQTQSASQRRDLLNFIERNDPEFIAQMYPDWNIMEGQGQGQGQPAASPSQRDGSVDPSLYESSN